MNQTLYTIDLIGTFVFAISGALAGSGKKLDIFGATFLAFVTAVGGGTVRDLLIGSLPVGWIQDINYLIAILAGVVCTYFFKRYILPLKKTLFIFDTIGIGVFTILGMNKALGLGIHPVMAIMMGMVSAVVGGVIRDTLTNEIPLIFRQEIYATACIAGGISFWLVGFVSPFPVVNVGITILVIIAIRVLAIRYRWSLPGIG
ncbi:MAG: trimeric intracellular cation channel family protein [Bacteroidia bacterium]